MKFKGQIFILAASMILGFGATAQSDAAVPESIGIQGTMEDTGGAPLSGEREYRVRFFDSATTGSVIGSPQIGTTTLSEAGRFSIQAAVPAAILNAGQGWYDLAIDSATPANGVSADDQFPNRVALDSVPFAMRADVTLDRAYDSGGAPGAGRTINANAGPVRIIGPDGLIVNGPLELHESLVFDPPIEDILTISCAAMRPNSSDDTYVQLPGYIAPDSSATPGTMTIFYAPVQLPEGAVITRLRAYLTDNDTPENIEVRLDRTPLDGVGTPSIMGFVETEDANNSPVAQMLDDTTISFNPIQNGQYQYQIRIEVVAPDTAYSELIHSVQIFYQLSEVELGGLL